MKSNFLRHVDTLIDNTKIHTHVKCHAHEAAVFKNNKLIFTGYNHDRNVFNGRVSDCGCSMHAEAHVIWRLLKVAECTTVY